MPYLAIIVPQIAEGQKDDFLGAWPTISKEMNAHPNILGTTGGQIVGEDGAPVTDFKFIQSIAFATLEDEKAFEASEWAQQAKAKYEGKAAGPPHKALFKVADFPKDAVPPKFTQFSRVTVSDESKLAEVRAAWEELVGILGKETFGGRSVEEGETIGLGLIGWDSLEEAKAAYTDPKTAAAWTKYHSLGSCKDVMVELK